jgi:hypothetical protein
VEEGFPCRHGEQSEAIQTKGQYCGFSLDFFALLAMTATGFPTDDIDTSADIM